MEIKLYHDRNRKSFKRHFPNAKWLGFDYGYYGPWYRVDEEEWEKTKHKLPKSLTKAIVKIEPDQPDATPN